MGILQWAGRSTSGILGRKSPLVRKLRPAYEKLLHFCSFGKGITWKINGVPFRIDPSLRHQMGNDYEEFVAEFLKDRVRPGAVCFDVGANVGAYVLQFANWSHPGGRVVAFEPNPEARRHLETHIGLNGFQDRVTVVDAAIGDQVEERSFYACGGDGMSRAGAPNEALANTKEISVSFLTLDEYCRRSGLIPDWLFIDIEGFEIAALKGASELLQTHLQRMNIVVEIHPALWESAGTSRSEAEAVLSKWGLRPVPLGRQTDPLGEYGIVYLEYQSASPTVLAGSRD